MRHPLTTTLTLLLMAEQRYSDRFEDQVYDVVAHLIDLAGWSDEKKADLYSLLVEAVTADMRMAQIEAAVSRALKINASRFPRG